MKQLHHWAKHMNFDMTECKLNRITDENGNPHFVISFPVEWHESTDPGIRGDGKFKVFEITKWEEVELEIKS